MSCPEAGRSSRLSRWRPAAARVRSMIQLGQYAPPTHTIAHLSDTHYLGASARSTARSTPTALWPEPSNSSSARARNPERVVFTGDLADLGEPDAVSCACATRSSPRPTRMGSNIIWVMGNHDERGAVSPRPARRPEDAEPQDRIYDIDGPANHLASTARCRATTTANSPTPSSPGSPTCSPLPRRTARCWRCTTRRCRRRSTDHGDHRAAGAADRWPTSSGERMCAASSPAICTTDPRTFAGIPVSVAAATCYTIDTSAPRDTLLGVDGGQRSTSCTVYTDTGCTPIVPIGDFTQVAGSRASSSTSWRR